VGAVLTHNTARVVLPVKCFANAILQLSLFLNPKNTVYVVKEEVSLFLNPKNTVYVVKEEVYQLGLFMRLSFLTLV
jgi:hypothetical protein